jgi:trypsin-like peptidase
MSGLTMMRRLVAVVPVMLGGVLAGLVINVCEWVVHRWWLNAAWHVAFAALGRTPRGWSIFIPANFGLGILAVSGYRWLAARDGAGWWTLGATAVAFWVSFWVVPIFAMQPLALFPDRLLWLTILVGAVDAPLATVVGVKMYEWLRRGRPLAPLHEMPSPRDSQLQAAVTALQLRAWSCAVTVRLARTTGDRETSWNTASGVLLEFPRRAVIGTAWHVLDEFRRLKAAGEDVVLICDNMPIESPCTAFRDERADIAFLEVPTRGRSGLHAVPYRPGSMWPPPAVKIEDTVLLCGFPKDLRHDGDEILHGDLNLFLDVASASDTHFMLQVEWERIIQAGRVKLSAQVDFAGASGGPVFLYDAGCNPLVGLISQAGNTLSLWRIGALAHVPADIQSVACERL